MRCIQILSIAIGFAFISQALPQVFRSHAASKRSIAAVNEIPIKDFLLSDFNGSSIADAAIESFRRSLSFVFADENSNTSTKCSATWTDTANSTGAPAGPSYTACAQTTGTSKPEFFIWYFASYADSCHFSLELAHEFSDPEYYTPPYDYVEYFAVVNVTLEYEDAAGTMCRLPARESPLHAIINNISN